MFCIWSRDWVEFVLKCWQTRATSCWHYWIYPQIYFLFMKKSNLHHCRALSQGVSMICLAKLELIEIKISQLSENSSQNICAISNQYSTRKELHTNMSCHCRSTYWLFQFSSCLRMYPRYMCVLDDKKSTEKLKFYRTFASLRVNIYEFQFEILKDDVVVSWVLPTGVWMRIFHEISSVSSCFFLGGKQSKIILCSLIVSQAREGTAMGEGKSKWIFPLFSLASAVCFFIHFYSLNSNVISSFWKSIYDMKTTVMTTSDGTRFYAVFRCFNDPSTYPCWFHDSNILFPLPFS